MKTTIFFGCLILWMLMSGEVQAKDIATYFNNATVDPTNYLSSFRCNSKDNLTEQEVRLWITKNKGYFYNTDSIIVKSEEHWVYGARHQMIKQVSFVTATNGPKRKAYFDGIKQAKENERLAAIKKMEDALQAEKDRLEQIKTGIEKGTYTGKAVYYYSIGKYDGDFVNGLRHGYGTQYFTDKGSTVTFGKGSYYQGYFQNDVFHGKGTFINSYGYEYTGQYINGEKHGEFVVYYKKDLFNAYAWKATYDNGILISEDFPAGLTPSISCEDQYLKDYGGLDKTKIKYGDFKEYATELRRMVTFPDGMSGYLFLEDSEYYISDGISSYYYKDYESTVRALFLFKKCGVVPVIGRKH